jgi:hypothetical protein
MSNKETNENDVLYELNAEQIRWLDEVEADYDAAKRALEVAQTHYENRVSALFKERRKFWSHIEECTGVDREVTPLEIKRHRCRMIVVKANGEGEGT